MLPCASRGNNLCFGATLCFTWKQPLFCGGVKILIDHGLPFIIFVCGLYYLLIDVRDLLSMISGMTFTLKVDKFVHYYTPLDLCQKKCLLFLVR